jgi:hypothetical protein
VQAPRGEETNPRRAEEVIEPNSSHAQAGNNNLNLDKGSEVVKDTGSLIGEGFGEGDQRDKGVDSSKAISQENSDAKNMWEGESSKAKGVVVGVTKEKNHDPPFCHKCKEYGHLAVDCRRGWPVNRGGNMSGNAQGERMTDLSEYVASLCAT